MRKGHEKYGGVTLVELIMVLMVISMIAGVAFLNYIPIHSRAKFKQRAQDITGMFELAYRASRESDSRYAVIIDFDEQMYILRQYKSLDFEGMDEQEAVLQVGYFDEKFQIVDVIFDDGESTLDRSRDEDILQLRAIFYAGRSGWQYGGKIILLDRDGNPWSLLVDRFSPVVRVVPGDIEVPMLEPIRSDEMFF